MTVIQSSIESAAFK